MKHNLWSIIIWDLLQAYDENNAKENLKKKDKKQNASFWREIGGAGHTSYSKQVKWKKWLQA